MYTFDEDSISDLHKDAFGVRPNACFWREWELLDDRGKQELWDQILECLRSSDSED